MCVLMRMQEATRVIDHRSLSQRKYLQHFADATMFASWRCSVRCSATIPIPILRKQIAMILATEHGDSELAT